jgi:hypothetical protein
MAGYDTAGEIQNVYASAHSTFKANPSFWMRYFAPSPAADVFESDPVSESVGAWDSGGKSIGPVNEPSQSRLASGSSSEGQADGQSFCAAIYSAYISVGPLNLPGDINVYCYLGQEASTSLTLGYWNAWAHAVIIYTFANNGYLPLYPCLYCDPPAAPPNCSIIGNPSAEPCLAVWASEPDPCHNSLTQPSWGPDSCSAATTRLWQYAISPGCGYSADVDIDGSGPGFTTSSYMFNLTSAP